MLWAKLRPARLPRGCNSIVVGTLYHLPSASDHATMEYLIKCLSTIESCYPNCGILIAGDFNRLQITRLRNNFQLKQMVHFPTRGRRTLDLILTNISEYYQDPIERPPFGLSDHASIELQPKERAHVKQPTITIKARYLRPSKRQKNGHLFGSCGCVHHDLRLRNVRRKGLAPGTDYNNRTWSYSSHSIPKGVLYRAPLDYIHTQRTDSSTSARPFPRG